MTQQIVHPSLRGRSKRHLTMIAGGTGPEPAPPAPPDPTVVDDPAWREWERLRRQRRRGGRGQRGPETMIAGGTGPEPAPPAPPDPTVVDEIASLTAAADLDVDADGYGLAARGILNRLARSIVAIHTNPIEGQPVVLATFDLEALPELAGLMYQGRREP